MAIQPVLTDILKVHLARIFPVIKPALLIAEQKFKKSQGKKKKQFVVKYVTELIKQTEIKNAIIEPIFLDVLIESVYAEEKLRIGSSLYNARNNLSTTNEDPPRAMVVRRYTNGWRNIVRHILEDTAYESRDWRVDPLFQDILDNESVLIEATEEDFEVTEDGPVEIMFPEIEE